MKQFNELFDLVKANRKTFIAKSFEESFQAFCLCGGVTGKGKKIVQPLFEHVKIRHELWAEDENSADYHKTENGSGTCNKSDGMEEFNENNGEETDKDEDAFGTYSKSFSV